MNFARFWNSCLNTIDFIVDAFKSIGEDFMVKSLSEIYDEYIGVGSGFVDSVLDVLGLESLTLLGLLFGLFGLYIIYQFATWVFNLVT